jgi:hypothetical protein
MRSYDVSQEKSAQVRHSSQKWIEYRLSSTIILASVLFMQSGVKVGSDVEAVVIQLDSLGAFWIALNVRQCLVRGKFI